MASSASVVGKLVNLNHRFHLSKGVQTCFDENVFADLTFVCKGNCAVHGHKALISSVSPCLRDFCAERADEHITVLLPDVDHKVVAAVLQLLYKGVVELSGADQILEFRAVVSMLGMQFDNIGDVYPPLIGNLSTTCSTTNPVVPATIKFVYNDTGITLDSYGTMQPLFTAMNTTTGATGNAIAAVNLSNITMPSANVGNAAVPPLCISNLTIPPTHVAPIHVLKPTISPAGISGSTASPINISAASLSASSITSNAQNSTDMVANKTGSGTKYHLIRPKPPAHPPAQSKAAHKPSAIKASVPTNKRHATPQVADPVSAAAKKKVRHKQEPPLVVRRQLPHVAANRQFAVPVADVVAQNQTSDPDTGFGKVDAWPLPLISEHYSVDCPEMEVTQMTVKDTGTAVKNEPLEPPLQELAVEHSLLDDLETWKQQNLLRRSLVKPNASASPHARNAAKCTLSRSDTGARRAFDNLCGDGTSQSDGGDTATTALSTVGR